MSVESEDDSSKGNPLVRYIATSAEEGPVPAESLIVPKDVQIADR
jgi:hypothetical protein